MIFLIKYMPVKVYVFDQSIILCIQQAKVYDFSQINYIRDLRKRVRETI